MTDMKPAEIPVTEENLWFLERQLNLFDFLDIFPADAISPPEPGARGVPIVLKTDLGFDIESDIDRSKMALRNRSRFSGWMRWTDKHGVKPGDKIVIEWLEERVYRLTLERAEADT